MALALIAAFWFLAALFLLFVPEHVMSASPAARRYGAIGCLIFAGSCLLGLLA
jgi:hypothetical protein